MRKKDLRVEVKVSFGDSQRFWVWKEKDMGCGEFKMF